MALPLESGMKFLAPISEGRYLPGYVVCQGQLFVLVNIYSKSQSDLDEPKEFPEERRILRDFVIGDHVFSKSKRVIEVPWKLFRNKKVENPLLPEHDRIVLGRGNMARVETISTNELVYQGHLTEEMEKFPKAVVHHASYYSPAVEAALLGKSVRFDEGEKRYVIE